MLEFRERVKERSTLILLRKNLENFKMKTKPSGFTEGEM